MGLTVAITGPTGDIGRALLRQVDSSPEVDRVIGMARRPFNPAVMLPVTLMSQGNHLLSRHANDLVSGIEKVLRSWTRSLNAERSRASIKSRRGNPAR